MEIENADQSYVYIEKLYCQHKHIEREQIRTNLRNLFAGFVGGASFLLIVLRGGFGADQSKMVGNELAFRVFLTLHQPL